MATHNKDDVDSLETENNESKSKSKPKQMESGSDDSGDDNEAKTEPKKGEISSNPQTTGKLTGTDTTGTSTDQDQKQCEEGLAKPPPPMSSPSPSDGLSAQEMEQKPARATTQGSKGSITISSTDEVGSSAQRMISQSLSATATATTPSTPGAFRVEGYASRERRQTNNNNSTDDSVDTIPRSNESSEVEADVESPVLEAEVSMSTNTNTGTQPTQQLTRSTTSDNVDISTAYVVEETEVRGVATVIKTWFGVDRRHFVIGMAALGTLLLIVLVLAIPSGQQQEQEQPINNVCGPLCGNGDNNYLEDAQTIVLGLSCEDWNLASLLPADNDQGDDDGSCDWRYAAAAYACGCPDASIPSNGCGPLCRSGSSLPDPDKVVRDVHGIDRTCGEWELLSQFDVTVDDGGHACANYNAVGVLCGCEENIPPPDACGSLCDDGAGPNPTMVVWGQSCEEWNTIATFLPVWEPPPTEETASTSTSPTCSSLFQDVKYRCECPEQKPPPDECNTLCQERSFCGPSMCQDESALPDPDRIVRNMACKDWSFFSRLTDHPEMCYFYDMVGFECGCQSNAPPSNACGPLCQSGDGLLPDPDRKVKGQSCSEWDAMSTFLFAGYGAAMPFTTSMIPSTCDAFFSPLAFGCGCPSVEPPLDGCGRLCPDGAPVPHPDRIVGDRTCGDYELNAFFETNPQTCLRYKNIIGPQCGCETLDSSETDFWKDLPCFTKEALDGKTFYFTAGISQYSASFGGETGGMFLQIQGNDSINIIGRFAGFESTQDSNDGSNATTSTVSYQASYGGGYRCGQFGPRRGSVVLVEDASIVVPKITNVIEPSTCVYQAILAVPEFCEPTD